MGDIFQIICPQVNLDTVKKAIENKSVKIESAEVCWIPKNNIDLDDATGRKVLGLMEALEDHDDVQNVYSNFNLPQTLLAEAQAAR